MATITLPSRSRIVAARGADPEFAGAVVVGLGQVLLAVEDLQEPEPEEEDPEQGQGDAAEDRDRSAMRLFIGGPRSSERRYIP